MNGPASSLLVVECLFLCSGGLWSLKLWPEGKCNLHRKKRERDANFSRPKARTAYRPLYVCMGRCLACAGTKTNTGLSELVGALGLCFVLFLVTAGEAADHICVFLLRDPAIWNLSEGRTKVAMTNGKIS